MQAKEVAAKWLEENDHSGMTYADIARAINAQDSVDFAHVTMRRAVSRLLSEDKAPREDSAEEAPPSEALGITLSTDRSFYNEADEVYIFWLRCTKGKAAIVEADYVREAKRRYSRWEESGKEETINQICADFGWSREFFVEMKRELGWTHDQDPFTAEEHVAAAVGQKDLLNDLVMMSRGQLERANKIRRWQETVKDAKKYREFMEGTWNPFKEYIENNPPADIQSVLRPVGERGNNRMALVQPADIHLGKRGVNGVEQMAEIVLDCTRNLMARLDHKNIDRLVLVLGNDLFHIDGFHKGTTRGTPQDTDRPVDEIVGVGYRLSRDLIDLMRAYGYPLDVYVVRSNHDDFSSSHLGWALRYMYDNVSGVKVMRTHRSRQYFSYGSNLIGLCHGHAERMGELGTLMANEVPELWGKCPFRYWHTGHLHYTKDEVVAEHGGHGVHIFQAPSPSVTDRWHDQKGYVLARRAVACYTYHRTRGHEDRMLANVNLGAS